MVQWAQWEQVVNNEGAPNGAHVLDSNWDKELDPGGKGWSA